MNRLTIIFLIGILACGSKDKGLNSETAQSNIASTILVTDSTTILGERYFGFGTKGPKVIVLNSKGDTVLNQPDLYFEFEFHDFNGDSLDDIVVHRLSNVPMPLLVFFTNKTPYTRTECMPLRSGGSMNMRQRLIDSFRLIFANCDF